MSDKNRVDTDSLRPLVQQVKDAGAAWTEKVGTIRGQKVTGNEFTNLGQLIGLNDVYNQICDYFEQTATKFGTVLRTDGDKLQGVLDYYERTEQANNARMNSGNLQGQSRIPSIGQGLGGN